MSRCRCDLGVCVCVCIPKLRTSLGAGTWITDGGLGNVSRVSISIMNHPAADTSDSREISTFLKIGHGITFIVFSRTK